MKITLILNILYAILLLLLAIDMSGNFDLHGQTLKTSVYFGSLLIALPLFIWNIIQVKKSKWVSLGLILPTVLVVFISIKGFTTYLFSSSAWHVQVIEYELKENPEWKIEKHIQDIGALGYNHRTVQCKHLTTWLIQIKPLPEEINKKWQKKDIYLNELIWIE